MHYLTHRYRSVYVLLLMTLLLLALPAGQLRAASQVIYADALATGWDNWSWAAVDLQATAQSYAGSNSIAVTYDGWEGLYLHHAGVSAAGFTRLRFYLHGGSTGGQKLQLYVTMTGAAGEVQGPTVALPSPDANRWSEVQLALSDLGAAGAVITGIVWQAASPSTQPTLYVDEIALIGDEHPEGPTLSAAQLAPGAAPADGSTQVVVRVQVADPQGQTDIASVALDARPLGRGSFTLRDDGRSNDGASRDGLYGGVLTIAPGTPQGEHVLLISAQDQAGHQASSRLGAFVVLASPGGSTPAALPQRLGWGTNQWSETDAEDWQRNSGVPWDYVYQYITYEWYIDGWGGNFVKRFVDQAWRKNYIPVISVYMFLATPPATGEDAARYAEKLQNPSTISSYLAALREAATQAQGTKPVIFQLEPDFYGFMQQLSNAAPENRPPGVRSDDPTSFPAALNIPGYPNNLAGFGRYMVDLIHSTAPNVLVAPHASMWATNRDPNTVTSTEVVPLAQRTAAFMNAMGGEQADLVFVEWSDRDAGSGLRPWWDDTNQNLPRPSRAILWKNALSAAMGKRLILWQMPVGNMSLDNTCGRYQDNRAAYAFGHPRDLADAGVIGVLFGGGAQCMTQPSTDGGFVAAQGAIAYAAPAAPGGLSAGPATGPIVPLRWNDLTLPDLWGYRLTYTRLPGGPSFQYNAGRRTAIELTLPMAGTWQIRVAAYDAMDKLGTSSTPIDVTTTIDTQRVQLPLLQR